MVACGWLAPDAAWVSMDPIPVTICTNISSVTPWPEPEAEAAAEEPELEAVAEAEAEPDDAEVVVVVVVPLGEDVERF
jgi:hypothetical protein